MQIADQRPDTVGGLLLRLADLVELRAELVQIDLLQQLAGDVYLE